MLQTKLLTPQFAEVVRQRSIPGITLWNRLEGRPQAEDFTRALKAEVRDALWMLTKQWQMGEFEGGDAGSPIFLKAHIETTRLAKYQPAGDVRGPEESYTDTVPLEAHVERMPIPAAQGGRDVSLDIRLLMGRYWLRLVKPLAVGARADFLAAYPIIAPDPTNPLDATVCAHPEAWSTFQCVAGRAMDGMKLYQHLHSPGGHAADGIPSLIGKESESDTLAARFLAWFDKLIYQPAENPAWLPERLEYAFDVSSEEGAGKKVLAASAFYQGHLDWYNFDITSDSGTSASPAINPPPPATTTLTMLPTRVTFNGMPNTRWWEFEDGATNFGDIKPDTTDLAKLLLIEFGLIYANDWFQVPFTVPAGSLANVRGLACTNVFGERFWIEAASQGDEDWRRWAMFLLSTSGEENQPTDLTLFVPPATQTVLEGPKLEEIALTRDEMSNMVWAVEKTISLPSGVPKPGREAADQLRNFFERDLERRLGVPPAPPTPAPGAAVRYQLMTTVPENWIPFIPVHVEDSNREIKLQRAAMLRTLEGDPEKPLPVKPRTSLMRKGLDEATATAYFLHEEEVPRAGVVVTQQFRRTRWRDGRAWVWMGVRKQTDRGGSSSGLAFDQITNV